MLALVAFLALCSLAQGNIFGDILKGRRCYETVGCFSNQAPFTNSWDELPASPQAIGVTLTLYTRAHPLKGEPLDYAQPVTVSETQFDPNADIKVIIHGYMNNGTEPWCVNLTKALLQTGALNVIKVAWGPGASSFYPKAVANTRVVGAVLATLLTSLRDAHNVNMSRVHLIGHSLGAHIAGYAGARVRGIGRISGLDPAGPLFEDATPEVRIDPTDAEFVDCIHTNGVPLTKMGFGTIQAWCNADYYPNGGGTQAGCPKALEGGLVDLFNMRIEDAEDDVGCSHGRSHDLFVDSILRCRYPSTPCASYQQYHAGQCSCPAGRCPPMGLHAADSGRAGGQYPQGKFYLTTTGTEPFC